MAARLRLTCHRFFPPSRASIMQPRISFIDNDSNPGAHAIPDSLFLRPPISLPCGTLAAADACEIAYTLISQPMVHLSIVACIQMCVGVTPAASLHGFALNKSTPPSTLYTGLPGLWPLIKIAQRLYCGYEEGSARTQEKARSMVGHEPKGNVGVNAG